MRSRGTCYIGAFLQKNTNASEGERPHPSNVGRARQWTAVLRSDGERLRAFVVLTCIHVRRQPSRRLFDCCGGRPCRRGRCESGAGSPRSGGQGRPCVRPCGRRRPRGDQRRASGRREPPARVWDVRPGAQPRPDGRVRRGNAHRHGAQAAQAHRGGASRCLLCPLCAPAEKKSCGRLRVISTSPACAPARNTIPPR